MSNLKRKVDKIDESCNKKAKSNFIEKTYTYITLYFSEGQKPRQYTIPDQVIDQEEKCREYLNKIFNLHDETQHYLDEDVRYWYYYILSRLGYHCEDLYENKKFVGAEFKENNKSKCKDIYKVRDEWKKYQHDKCEVIKDKLFTEVILFDCTMV